MVQITVNGQSCGVAEGTMLLEAVRRAGVDLPTLCHQEGLSPYGACRLCMVALRRPRQALVAACAYPVEEGLVVETAAPEAVASRRLAAEFLLSRCPESQVIRTLAAREGVTETRFPPAPEQAAELCMLCGLCVRVCREAIGAAAISFIGRGLGRKVETPFAGPSEACIGCGACAEVCPTGAIRIEDRGNLRLLHTWHTTVELQACPSCGRFFAPRPTAFLREMLPEIADLWALCPECRARRTGAQWAEQVREKGTSS